MADRKISEEELRRFYGDDFPRELYDEGERAIQFYEAVADSIFDQFAPCRFPRVCKWISEKMRKQRQSKELEQ